MLRIMHTSDWHIGHTLHSFDRAHEHKAFLQWLLGEMETQQVDALLISGDIFDSANPSATSQRLFNEFLAKANSSIPHLTLVFTAGNHDSPTRLEAPALLLEALGIRVTGTFKRLENGDLDFASCLVPLSNRNGDLEAWCAAVPFLRNSEICSQERALSEEESPAQDGFETIYRKVVKQARKSMAENHALIAMGHCHLASAEISPDSERPVITGGLEGVPWKIFETEFQYVALGHLHLAQKVGGFEHIRYSGSPIPMSFSEIHYRHQVLTADFVDGRLEKVLSTPVPRFVDLMRIPASGPGRMEDVLKELRDLTLPENLPAHRHPYLLVRVKLSTPEPTLRFQVEEALRRKPVRLARIEIRSDTSAATDDADSEVVVGLDSLQPEDVFRKMHQARFGAEAPEKLLSAFRQLMFQEGEQG